MKKQILFLALSLFVLNANAQKGTIDCSQTIKSDILAQEMPYSVYLPDGYHESNRQYPVLYLLHGKWDNYTGWVRTGEVNTTANKLIVAEKIPEMIIIMPDGLIDSYYINNYDKSVCWEDFFYQEFIPNIEKKYRIFKNRENRAIAGLSMGGYGALYHSIKHKDMFKACYALSAAVLEISPLQKEEKRSKEVKDFQNKTWGKINKKGLPQNYKKHSVQEMIKSMDTYNQYTTKNPLPAITLDCGDDDFLLNENMHLAEILKQKKIPFELRIRDGAHTWEYWRSNLKYALINIGKSFRN